MIAAFTTTIRSEIDLDLHPAENAQRRAEFARQPEHVWEVLRDGAERARVIARETMRQVHEAVGLPS